jgi:hypothetical protein
MHLRDCQPPACYAWQVQHRQLQLDNSRSLDLDSILGQLTASDSTASLIPLPLPTAAGQQSLNSIALPNGMSHATWTLTPYKAHMQRCGDQAVHGELSQCLSMLSTTARAVQLVTDMDHANRPAACSPNSLHLSSTAAPEVRATISTTVRTKLSQHDTTEQSCPVSIPSEVCTAKSSRSLAETHELGSCQACLVSSRMLPSHNAAALTEAVPASFSSDRAKPSSVPEAQWLSQAALAPEGYVVLLLQHNPLLAWT